MKPAFTQFRLAVSVLCPRPLSKSIRVSENPNSANDRECQDCFWPGHSKNALMRGWRRNSEHSWPQPSPSTREIRKMVLLQSVSAKFRIKQEGGRELPRNVGIAILELDRTRWRWQRRKPMRKYVFTQPCRLNVGETNGEARSWKCKDKIMLRKAPDIVCISANESIIGAFGGSNKVLA